MDKHGLLLYKYTYLCGDGSDTCGVWEDLSTSIPANRPTTFDNFNAQGGYDLLVKVKPDNPDIVFIGGTNLWRSTDGFQSDSNTAQIGGITKAPITDKETGIFTTPTTPINTTCYFYLQIQMLSLVLLTEEFINQTTVWLRHISGNA